MSFSCFYWISPVRIKHYCSIRREWDVHSSQLQFVAGLNIRIFRPAVSDRPFLWSNAPHHCCASWLHGSECLSHPKWWRPSRWFEPRRSLHLRRSREVRARLRRHWPQSLSAMPCAGNRPFGQGQRNFFNSVSDFFYFQYVFMMRFYFILCLLVVSMYYHC